MLKYTLRFAATAFCIFACFLASLQTLLAGTQPEAFSFFPIVDGLGSCLIPLFTTLAIRSVNLLPSRIPSSPLSKKLGLRGPLRAGGTGRLT